MSLEVRQTAEREIQRYHTKTGLPITALLKYAGIPHRTWREWARRRGAETKHNNNIPKSYRLTPEEVQAIIAYCVNNALKGCRMLCWEMVDKDVAFVSCSSVYNVIKRHNLDKKWAEASSYATAVQINKIAASTDPVALDYWASKNILMPEAAKQPGGRASSMNPDGAQPGTFGYWLRLSMNELHKAGITATMEEAKIQVILKD